MINNSFHALCESADQRILLCSSYFEKDKEFVIACFDSVRDRHSSTICFDIGNKQDLIGMRMVPELFKLPYDTCWFEGDRKAPDSDSVKVGFFCCNGIDESVLTQIYTKHPVSKQWVLMFYVQSKHDKKSEQTVSCCVPSSETAQMVCVDLMGWIIAFLSALNCINIRRVKHSPDLALQKARIKRGKKPLFETWTLEIDLSKSDKDTVGLGGTHASPRVHLRRGHARQHREGHWCWVQPHIVGSKDAGMINKDYSVKSDDDGKAA